MSSPYFVKCDDRCHHLKYRVGCKSCKLHDLTGRLELFKLQTQEHAHSMASCASSLEAENLDQEQRELIKEERVIAEQAHEDARSYVEGYESQVAHMQEAVSEIIISHEPDAVAAAFETDAAAHEEAMLAVWQKKTSNKKWRKWTEALSPADKAVVPAVLDRSKIRATPDRLVGMGHGLQMFLKEGRAQMRVPGNGQSETSAAMSFGAALAQFGTPTLRTWTPPEKRADMLAEMMAECKISPVTEADGLPVTEALLTPEQQWNLFHEKMGVSDVAMLADYYMYTVRQQQYEQEEKDGEDESTGKGKGKAKAEDSTAEAEAVEIVDFGSNGWPVPQGSPTWTNFTNWIALCISCQPKDGELVFRDTLATWAEQRRACKERIAAALAAWTPPADFDDGSSLYPKPTEFYSHDVSLLQMDAERLGWKLNEKKDD